MAVSVSWRRSSQTDIRGLVTAGRAVSSGSVRWSKGRAWQREPLLLIVGSRVTSTRCHSRSVTAWWLCVLLLVLGSWGQINVPSAARPAGRPPWPTPNCCLAGGRRGSGSRAAGSRRAAIAERPLTLEGRPLGSVRGADRRCCAKGKPCLGFAVAARGVGYPLVMVTTAWSSRSEISTGPSQFGQAPPMPTRRAKVP